MIDWQDKVERAHLVCARSGEPIPPGSRFFSALVFRDGRFQRLDFLPAAWEQEDRAPFLSWWRMQRPEERSDNRPRIVSRTVLLGIFNDIKDSRERPQQCFAWLLALLLTRAKALRYLDLVHDGEDSFLLVEERGGPAHRIRDPRMTGEEEAAVQEDLRSVFEMGGVAASAGEGHGHADDDAGADPHEDA